MKFKTAEEILIGRYGSVKLLEHFKEHGQNNLTVEDTLEVMQEYAVQFIKPSDCYNCNGTGEVGNTDCIVCKGVGKLIILPTITTTGT